MTKFITGDENIQAIKNLLNDKNDLKCAVAFWGDEALHFLENTNRKVKIICNLESGATNPYVISKLIDNPNIDIKTHQRLHAKVYWSPTLAIIGSTNVSANGLGLEGRELSGWIEASILIDEDILIKKIEDWFDLLYLDSFLIDDSALARAKNSWKDRRKIRPVQLVEGDDKIEPKSASILLNLTNTINGTFSKYIIEFLEVRPHTVRELHGKVKARDQVFYEEVNNLYLDGMGSHCKHRLNAAMESLKNKGIVIRTDDNKGSRWKLISKYKNNMKVW